MENIEEGGKLSRYGLDTSKHGPWPRLALVLSPLVTSRGLSFYVAS